MSERMIIDALPARNNILLGIVATNTGNAVVDAMIRGAFRACLEELDDAPKVEVQEWRRASDPPPPTMKLGMMGMKPTPAKPV